MRATASGGVARARSGVTADLVVHLSVAIGRFFEALLYALFGIALWTTLAVVGGVVALFVAFKLARRLVSGDKRRR